MPAMTKSGEGRCGLVCMAGADPVPVRPVGVCRLAGEGTVTAAVMGAGRVVICAAVVLWDGLEGLDRHYEIEAVSSASSVTHVTLTRTGT